MNNISQAESKSTPRIQVAIRDDLNNWGELNSVNVRLKCEIFGGKGGE